MSIRYLKKIYLIIMICLMFFIPISAKAEGEHRYINDNGVIVNKIYNSIAPEKSSYDRKYLYNSSIYYCNDLNDLKDVIRICLRNKKEVFTINYSGDISNLKNDLEQSFYKVCEEQDDYFKNNYSRVSWSANGVEGSVNITYKIYHLTTAEEDAYLDNQVDIILSKIIKENMNEDDKERVIHDYIVKNVTYDVSLQRHSAYNALAEGKTVCQGYALLTYKMLKKVGIDTRIVVGKGIDLETGKEESHAWNLVKIRGDWYQLDCTWDDPIPDIGKVSYKYYNLTDSKMSIDHLWDKYNYPAANTLYVDKRQNSENSDIKIDFANYRKWKEAIDTPVNKVWTISFKGGDVDKTSVNNDNVYVFDENSKSKIGINVVVARNKIMVTSKLEYEKGHTYCLVIEKSVLSLKGEEIPSPIVMRFKI